MNRCVGQSLTNNSSGGQVASIDPECEASQGIKIRAATPGTDALADVGTPDLVTTPEPMGHKNWEARITAILIEDVLAPFQAKGLKLFPWW